MPKVFVSWDFFKGTHGGKRIFQETCESWVRREGRLERCGNRCVSFLKSNTHRAWWLMFLRRFADSAGIWINEGRMEIQSCKTISIVYVDHMVLQLANKLHIITQSMNYWWIQDQNLIIWEENFNSARSRHIAIYLLKHLNQFLKSLHRYEHQPPGCFKSKSVFFTGFRRCCCVRVVESIGG